MQNWFPTSSKWAITQKMVDQERSDFCVVFTMILCSLKSKQTLISLPFQFTRLLKLGIKALESCLKLTCEYEFHIVLNAKVCTAKDHREDYMKVRPPLVCHL